MTTNNELPVEIGCLLQDFPGIAGVVIRDAQDSVSFEHNAGQIFPAASLIKLAILLAYYLAVERRLLDPLQREELRRNQIVGDTGILQDLTPGCRLTIQDLAMLMIIVSDNTATNMMIDLLGISNINQTIQTFNLKDTILQRKMYDWAAQEKGLENFTSPADMARLLRIFLFSDKLSAASRAGIMGILNRQRIQHKLPALTPPDADWAHKTGELPSVEHDVGILRVGDEQLIVSVLTKSLESNEDGCRLISEIGRAVYHGAQ